MIGASTVSNSAPPNKGVTTPPTDSRSTENEVSGRQWRPGHRRDIKVGSVWRSRDPRDNGRLVTVESEPSQFGNDYVGVRSVRRSNLRTITLLERYDLFEEAPDAD